MLIFLYLFIFIRVISRFLSKSAMIVGEICFYMSQMVFESLIPMIMGAKTVHIYSIVYNALPLGCLLFSLFSLRYKSGSIKMLFIGIAECFCIGMIVISLIYMDSPLSLFYAISVGLICPVYALFDKPYIHATCAGCYGLIVVCYFCVYNAIYPLYVLNMLADACAYGSLLRQRRMEENRPAREQGLHEGVIYEDRWVTHGRTPSVRTWFGKSFKK